MLWVFLTGLILGSFYNVVILRTITGESILFPASHCTKCKTPIEWKYKIPVISYIFLRGKCAYCSSKIDIMYPIIETLTAIMFLFLFWKFGLTYRFFLSAIIMSLFLILAGMDTKSNKIAPKYAYALILAGIAYNYPAIINSIAGGILGYLFIKLLLTISNRLNIEITGDGDMLLIAALGSFTGLNNLWFFLIAAFIFQAIFCLPQYIKHLCRIKNYFLIFALIWFLTSYFMTIISINFPLIWKNLIFLNLICSVFCVSKALVQNLKNAQKPNIAPFSPAVFCAALLFLALI